MAGALSLALSLNFPTAYSMRRSFQYWFSILLLSIFFVACHSDKAQVAAAPGPSPRFHDEPKKFGNIQLAYTDTTTAEWRHIAHRLDSFYATQVRAGFNGSVLLGYKGKIMYERYFGWGDREHQVPLCADCAGQLASVSKTFTGTAVMYLYQHKYLDINDPVQHYIPDFPYPALTLKMLLSHRSGLPDYTHWAADYCDQKTPINNVQMLQMMAKYKPALEFKPDTRFKYSNTNFAVLARVVEVVSEMPFKDFMRRYIFDQLGMQHTFVFDPATPVPAGTTVSYKFNWMREPIMFADGVYGDKGIYSTVRDMYRWDQSFYNHTLLDEATQQLAYTGYSNEKAGIKNYGLGWRMLNYPDGGKIIYHNGWWHGNNTSFYRLVQDDFTIIVLGNRFSNAIYHQAPVLYSIVKNAGEEKGGFDNSEE